MNKIQLPKLSKLTHSELIRMYLGAQGDMTLVPGDARRTINKELAKEGFIELVRRQSIMCKKGKQ